MHIVLFGAPGVGKGTQAKILSLRLGVPHISTGEILRESVRSKSSLGLKAKTLMDKGELVPDNVMIGIIRDKFLELGEKTGFILDGFPRTVSQAIEFDLLIEEMSLTNVAIIAIEVDEEQLVERLANRRACKNCHAIFNVAEIEGLTICPNCANNTGFYHRNDDTSSVIRNRMKVYRDLTEPVIDFFKGRRKIGIINGLGSVDDVTKDILESLSEFIVVEGVKAF